MLSKIYHQYRFIIIIIIGAVIFLTAIVFLFKTFRNTNLTINRPNPENTNLSLTLEPTSTPEQSIYATDSSVLSIERELKSLENDLNKIDLNNPEINPPVLDMDIKF
jgi:hypothetical protein